MTEPVDRMAVAKLLFELAYTNPPKPPRQPWDSDAAKHIREAYAKDADRVIALIDQLKGRRSA